MKISLIHPSRGRPVKCFDTAEIWLKNAGIEVEYITSIDNDDPMFRQYFNEARRLNRQGFVIHYDNKSVVEATNSAAKRAAGDILVYLSDDFKCPENWGQLILKEFENVERPLLIKVDDCLQNFTTPVLTIPIMNRQLYQKLGYFWHPEYKSMFVDNDLYWTAMKLNAMKMCPHLKFAHEHPSNGKAVTDETYQRSAANWDQGKALFNKRKSMGFPL